MQIILGRKGINLCLYGQINLFPLNVCRDGHVHYTCSSPMVPRILFTTNHLPFPRCALLSHFPLWGTCNSRILKCPGQLWALPNKHCPSNFGDNVTSSVKLSWFIYVELGPYVSSLPQHCAHLLYNFQNVVFNNFFFLPFHFLNKTNKLYFIDREHCTS